MNKLKMLVLALFAAIVTCGCGDNALAYVESDAEWVVYGNTEQLLEHDLWDVIEDFDEFKMLEKEFEKNVGLELKDLDGNIAVWGTFSVKKREPEVSCVAVVLNKKNAEAVFNVIKKACKDDEYSSEYYRKKMDEITIDGCKAIVMKREYLEGEKWEKTVVGSVVLVDKKTILFYPEKEPSSVLKPKNNSKLAKQIDRDSVFAGAVSGDLLRAGMKVSGVQKAPKVGDAVFQLKLKRNELKIEGTVDISDIDDD